MMRLYPKPNCQVFQAELLIGVAITRPHSGTVYLGERLFVELALVIVLLFEKERASGVNVTSLLLKSPMAAGLILNAENSPPVALNAPPAPIKRAVP